MSSFLTKLWPEFEVWVSSLGCIRKGYHGRSYEGNTSKRILEQCDELDNLLPVELLPLLEPLRKFRVVVQVTFENSLDLNHKDDIQAFTQSYVVTQEYCKEVGYRMSLFAFNNIVCPSTFFSISL